MVANAELCPEKDLNVQNFRFESSQIFDLTLKIHSKNLKLKIWRAIGTVLPVQPATHLLLGIASCYGHVHPFSRKHQT